MTSFFTMSCCKERVKKPYAASVGVPYPPLKQVLGRGSRFAWGAYLHQRQLRWPEKTTLPWSSSSSSPSLASRSASSSCTWFSSTATRSRIEWLPGQRGVFTAGTFTIPWTWRRPWIASRVFAWLSMISKVKLAQSKPFLEACRTSFYRTFRNCTPSTTSSSSRRVLSKSSFLWRRQTKISTCKPCIRSRKPLVKRWRWTISN